MAKGKKFRVKPDFLQRYGGGFTVILFPDESPKRVSLSGEVTITEPASDKGPEQMLKIPGPTERELEWLFNTGNPFVEVLDDEKETGLG